MVTVTVGVPRHICQDCVVVRWRPSHTLHHWVCFPDSCLVVNKVDCWAVAEVCTLLVFYSRFWLHPCDTPTGLFTLRRNLQTAAYFISERISELYNLRKAIITPNRYSILVCRESGELRRKKKKLRFGSVCSPKHSSRSFFVPTLQLQSTRLCTGLISWLVNGYIRSLSLHFNDHFSRWTWINQFCCS